MGKYDALDVARFILSYFSYKNQPISNLKLQKTLYYTWIDYYNETGDELFSNDICAWQLGPVVPDVYYEYCAYGGRPINILSELKEMGEDSEILIETLEKYKDISAGTLVDMTHQSGTPWDYIYNGLGNREVIPFKLIKDLECKNQI